MNIQWAGVSLAFGAGMLATVNPCGFAMLPAYLSFFAGMDEGPSSRVRAVLRALLVGLVLTAGFTLVFLVFGVLLSSVKSQIDSSLPWVTVVFGFILFGLGVAMLRGFEPKIRIPRFDKGGEATTLPSMFIYGVSFAVASLSCAIGPFITAVAGTASGENGSYPNAVAHYLAYAFGMGLVVTVLTLAVALAKSSLVTRIRSVLPYVNRIAGIFLIIAGLYVAYYGWYEVRVLRGDFLDPDASAPLVDTVEGWRNSLVAWITEQQTVIGWVTAVAVAVAVGYVALRRRGPGTDPIEPTDPAIETEPPAEPVAGAETPDPTSV